MQKIGIIGSGVVGETLANGFLAHGHDVLRAAREPSKLDAWKAKAGPKAQTGTFADAARFGDVVVLAVKGGAAESALDLCGLDALRGKTVIDTTNPIAEAPPTDGVLAFFTGPNDSLLERLQKRAPDVHFVKAFSCVGSASMVNPDYGGEKPSMFLCGNDEGAKAQVSKILTVFGWEAEDMGGAIAARAIEPLCMLWCIRGFRQNQWTHAFRLLKR